MALNHSGHQRRAGEVEDLISLSSRGREDGVRRDGLDPLAGDDHRHPLTCSLLAIDQMTSAQEDAAGCVRFGFFRV